MPVTKDPHQQEIVQLNAQRVREALAKYEAPPIRVGRQVRWSPVADFSYGETVLGWVDKVHNGTLNLTLMGEGYGGMSRVEVPHISDPRLGLNSDWKQNGAWDYAEEESDNSVAIDRIAGELKKIGSTVTSQAATIKSLSERVVELETDVAALRVWADALGVEEPLAPPAKPNSTNRPK